MGRTGSQSTVSATTPFARTSRTGDGEESGEATSRGQLARRLHRVLAIGGPVFFWFAVRSGVRVDRSSFALLAIASWPFFLWGAVTRTPRVKLHALLVIVPIYAVAAAGLIEVGPMPGATAGLMLPIVLVGLFFGRRAAWGTTLLVVVTVVAVGGMFRQGWLAAPLSQLSDITRMDVWLRVAAAESTIGLVMVTAVTTLLARYERALDEARRAIRELHAEQERRQREAREAVQVRDDFLVIASHELRTPLTPLVLEVQALERRHRGDLTGEGVDLSARLRKTVAHVHRLARLVDELLDVSHILAGNLTVRLEPVDLAAVVRGVAERFAEALARSGSSFALDGPPEGCVGLWDPSRLDQVMTNLLSNAIKYGAGKPIEVSIEATPSVATLTLRDHGIGIEAGASARVFGRFERAAPSKHYGGFGVGLWVVKQVLDALDGHVRLESTPGVGTTFFVVLPRGAHAGDEPRSPAGDGERESGSEPASESR
jgi:signal transduction histidine kinase